MWLADIAILTRPEDTHKSWIGVLETDLNLLYWGGGECEMAASQVCGKCEVVFGEDIVGDRDEWFMHNMDRFYFYEAYDCHNKTFLDPPASSRLPGRKGKVCGLIGGCGFVYSSVGVVLWTHWWV